MTWVNGNVIMSGCGDDDLTMQDEKRLEIIQRVYRSELTVVEAALVMGISERQCYRVKARVRKAGAKGVIMATVDGGVKGRLRRR